MSDLGPVAFSTDSGNLADQPKTAGESHLLLLKQKKYCDVTFKFPNLPNRIEAHEIYLKARSPVFEQIFRLRKSGNVQGDEIEISESTPETFQHFLEFIYVDKFEADSAGALDLLQLALKYKIQPLTDKCEEVLKSETKAEESVKVFEAARCLGRQDLMDRAAEIMVKSFPYLMETGALANAEEETLVYLLERDDLNVEEVKLFQLILDWARSHVEYSADESILKDTLKNVISKIRYTNMTLLEFTKLVVPTGFLSAEESLSVYSYLSGDEATRASLKIKFNTTGRKVTEAKPSLCDTPKYHRPANKEGTIEQSDFKIKVNKKSTGQDDQSAANDDCMIIHECKGAHKLKRISDRIATLAQTTDSSAVASTTTTIAAAPSPAPVAIPVAKATPVRRLKAVQSATITRPIDAAATESTATSSRSPTTSPTFIPSEHEYDPEYEPSEEESSSPSSPEPAAKKKLRPARPLETLIPLLEQHAFARSRKSRYVKFKANGKLGVLQDKKGVEDEELEEGPDGTIPLHACPHAGCVMIFKTVEQCHSHERSLHKESNKNAKCYRCDGTFSTSHYLWKHEEKCNGTRRASYNNIFRIVAEINASPDPAAKIEEILKRRPARPQMTTKSGRTKRVPKARTTQSPQASTSRGSGRKHFMTKSARIKALKQLAYKAPRKSCGDYTESANPEKAARKSPPETTETRLMQEIDNINLPFIHSKKMKMMKEQEPANESD